MSRGVLHVDRHKAVVFEHILDNAVRGFEHEAFHWGRASRERMVRPRQLTLVLAVERNSPNGQPLGELRFGGDDGCHAPACLRRYRGQLVVSAGSE